MKTLQLLVLEDNSEDAKDLVLLCHKQSYHVTIAKTINEATALLQTMYFDVIILDIMINGKPDGITFAETLNIRQVDIPFLFLTNIQTKTIFEKAKYTKPFNYLLKPYNALEVLYAIELAIETHYKQKHTLSLSENNGVLCPEFLFIKKKRSVVKVSIKDINYIKVDHKYCDLVSDNDTFLIKLSLARVQGILPHKTFRQTHRNYLVNLEKIKEIFFEDSLIVLDNETHIPISERYKAKFIKNNNVFR